ncbi:YhdP family protein [Pararhizobium sp. O133]|uniref:YhdP family protein n=1 Tax=Pararhizobium sp. O133 TaxID=3449278 RepID=UPI003F683C7E
MSDIRGEKVSFRKQDIVVLHSLPSAQAHDPCIVHAPAKRGILRLIFTTTVVITALFCLAGAALLAAIEGGFIDGPLNARATTALNAAIGKGYHAEVGSTVLRVTGNGGLALKAQDVTLVENVSAKRLVTTDSVFIELNPLALFSGRISVSRIEAEGAMLDPSLLPQGKPIDVTAIRVGHVAEGLETVFAQMDAVSRLLDRSNTEIVRIADLKLSFAGPRKRVVPVVVESVDFKRGADGSMKIDGLFNIDGETAELHLSTDRRNGRVIAIDGAAMGLPLAALLYRNPTETELAFGIKSSADLSIKATRAGEGAMPSLQLKGRSNVGSFDAGGFTSQLQSSELNVTYDFTRNRVEILPSTVRVGRSSFPFTGAVADLDQVETGAPKGFVLDLLVQSASSSPTDVTEAPLIFDAKASGRFLSETHELVFNELTVASGLGNAAGSLAMSFGDESPQISFALLTPNIQSAAVKQLWPWWVGKTARRWVINNIYGGTVTDGRIEVFLPMGRITRTVGPVDLNAEELNVQFHIDDARVNLAGDIPPLRDAAGDFTLKGERLDVAISQGTAYFPSGRSVKLNGGDFVIPNTYEKPLIAEMKLDVGGQADAIAELVSYRPLLALQKTPFKVEDFSGELTAQVGARFGLVTAQKPPPPQWQAEMALNGVTLNKPMSGRMISDIKGTLRIDPQQAVLEAKAQIDGTPMDLELTEPVGSSSPVKRQRKISGTLQEAALVKLAPGLSGIIDGPVALDISIDDRDQQTVTADLDQSTISLPWIGWSKGSGIGAKATFSASTTDGVTQIDDLEIDGDSFGAKGKLVVDKSGLNSGQFTSVQLAKGDNYAVRVNRQKNGFAVSVNGSAADIRPVIDSLRRPGGSSTSSGKRIALEANLDKVTGFHGETLANFNLNYAGRGRDIDVLGLSAVTDSGQAVVAKMTESGADNTLELTSGDAGSLARFANLYSNMRGGLLNLKLRDRGAGSWRGNVDVRKFSLVDEERLQSIVSTPTGADGRSLNQAVKKDINVSSARFERGFANLVLDNGTVAVEGGVVRGVDVGATFQGVVRDRNGNMSMTGTFMPAYGLNRLFGELPIIGVLLGNGRDRGLLGITFKLEGPFSKPKLTINPLSIIAPGVFRNIFEFQ